MRLAIRSALENTAKRTMIGNEISAVSICSASEVNQVAESTEASSRAKGSAQERHKRRHTDTSGRCHPLVSL